MVLGGEDVKHMKPIKMSLFCLSFVLGSYLPAWASETCGPVVLAIETNQEVVSFNVEIANTPETRRKGLMNRTELAADAGLLFVFPSQTTIAFWMKDTLIPLDMLFIDAAGAIQFIKHEAQPNDLTLVPSPQGIEAKAVLEIKGGQAAKLGIDIGSDVQKIWSDVDEPTC